MLRRYSDTVTVATVDLDDIQPGWYLVEAAGGDEFVEIGGDHEGLVLAIDGRAFPKDRAHYIVGIVQLLLSNEDEQPKSVAELNQPADYGEKGGTDGNDPDQAE